MQRSQEVDEYIASLPEDRRDALGELRELVLANLPEGYEESFQFGMPSYVVPLARFRDTYNKQPLTYASFASQKRYMTLYLMNIYSDAESERWFHERFQASGKRLDMGKSCVRFKRLTDLPLDLIGEAIALMPVEGFIERYKASRGK